MASPEKVSNSINKTTNSSAAKNSSDEDLFELLIDIIPNEEIRKEFKQSHQESKKIEKAFKVYQKQKDEKAKAIRKETIERENQDTPMRIGALQSFHQYSHACSIDEYLDATIPIPEEPVSEDYYKRNRVNPNSKSIFFKKQRENRLALAKNEYYYDYEKYKEEKSEVLKNRNARYKSITDGDKWFREYILYSIRENQKKVFDNCKQEYVIDLYVIPESTSKMELHVGIPTYKSFNPVKKIHYDVENNKEIVDYLNEEERKKLYISFVYSVFLQAMAIVFDCADHVANMESTYPVEMLKAVCLKGFFDDGFGKNMYGPVIISSMSKEEYHKMNVALANPRKALLRLNSIEFDSLFFLDCFDPLVIETAYTQKKELKIKFSDEKNVKSML